MLDENVKNRLFAIADWLCENDGFTIVAHTSPDGDALGSCIALYAALTELGKKAEVVCDYPVPRVYSFLPFAQKVSLPENAQGYSHVISIDCADMGRMGGAQPFFNRADSTANIDHHFTNSVKAGINAVDSEAAAAGELVYVLVKRLLPDFGREIAICLYTAIMTDTGNFAYSNTAPSTHEIAAALLEKGVDNTEINRRVYRSIPLCKQMLLGRSIAKLEMHCGGTLAYTFVSLADMAAVGATEEDTEGIIDSLRDIDTVEVAIMVREAGKDTYKASFRSKRAVDVGAICARFGGGGHMRAAGCTVNAECETMRAELLAASGAALKETGIWKE